MLKSPKAFLSFLLEHLIRGLLFLFICAMVVNQVAGTSDKIKYLVSQNNTYGRFIPALIADNKAAQKQQPQNNSLNYSDPEIERIFQESFPARDVKAKTESVINAAYAWLTQRTPTLDATIDITKNKELLADKLSLYAFNRLDNLPACNLTPDSVNPLTIDCNPGNYDRFEGLKSYRSELMNSQSFLPKTVFTAADLPKNQQGKSIVDQYSFAPEIYRFLNYGWLIIGSAVLLCGAAFVSLNKRKRQGVASFAMILISTGSGLVITPIVFNIILPYFTKSMQLSPTGSETQKIFEEIINKATQRIILIVILYGALILLAGILIYLFEKSTRPTTKYSRISERSGIASSIERLRPDDPRNKQGKLNASNVPLQTSDGQRKKDSKSTSRRAKYRKMYEKKGL